MVLALSAFGATTSTGVRRGCSSPPCSVPSSWAAKPTSSPPSTRRASATPPTRRRQPSTPSPDSTGPAEHRHHHADVAWVAANQGKLTGKNSETVEIVGFYWHFVDLVWIFIFTVIYLIPPEWRHERNHRSGRRDPRRGPRRSPPSDGNTSRSPSSSWSLRPRLRPAESVFTFFETRWILLVVVHDDDLQSWLVARVFMHLQQDKPVLQQSFFAGVLRHGGRSGPLGVQRVR